MGKDSSHPIFTIHIINKHFSISFRTLSFQFRVYSAKHYLFYQMFLFFLFGIEEALITSLGVQAREPLCSNSQPAMELNWWATRALGLTFLISEMLKQ